jgi:hypothetical protein
MCFAQIMLRGPVSQISPVGGVKEKALGAHRAGANKVTVPWVNRKDVELGVPKEVHACVQFVFARTVWEHSMPRLAKGHCRGARSRRLSGAGYKSNTRRGPIFLLAVCKLLHPVLFCLYCNVPLS